MKGRIYGLNSRLLMRKELSKTVTKVSMGFQILILASVLTIAIVQLQNRNTV
jgi:hypothetical protein